MNDTNHFGFKLADEKYRTEVLEILGSISNSVSNSILVNTFSQKDSGAILSHLAAIPNTIEIEGKFEADFDVGDDGETYPIGAQELPYKILIKDKNRVSEIVNSVKATFLDIYITGVNSFLQKNETLKWRCATCSRWLKELKSAKEIHEELDLISSGKWHVCHKCRTVNSFSITEDGLVVFKSNKK